MTDRNSILKLIDEELIKANAEYPKFHSYHEAYAVIKEELEEAAYEMEKCKENLETAWLNIKRDMNCTNNMIALRTRSINLIQEAIQVAAMCDKTFDSLK